MPLVTVSGVMSAFFFGRTLTENLVGLGNLKAAD